VIAKQKKNRPSQSRRAILFSSASWPGRAPPASGGRDPAIQSEADYFLIAGSRTLYGARLGNEGGLSIRLNSFC
jgi:hypothetical protein